MPAQSVLGQVGCLPGRTIAFRRSIMVKVMDKFMTERFMGVFLEVSDDRTLTNLTLKEGFRTVYQHTSLVYTDAPLQIKKLFKQQLRWARGSQYNTMRMLPWMLGHAPVLSIFFVMDIILPFLLAGVIAGWVYRAVTGQGYNFYEGILSEYGLQGGVLLVLGLMLISSVLSMAIRQIRHLSEKPSDFFRLPVFIIVSTTFLMPIRLLGFFRMGHASGWGTRAGAYAGGAANNEIVSGLGGGPRVDETEFTLDWDATGQPVPVTSSALVPSAGGALPAGAQYSGTQHAGSVLEASPRRAAAGRIAAQTAPPARRLNPKAAWPYIIGFAIFALEAFFIVNF
jgi:hyaluronan synthase